MGDTSFHDTGIRAALQSANDDVWLELTSSSVNLSSVSNCPREVLWWGISGYGATALQGVTVSGATGACRLGPQASAIFLASAALAAPWKIICKQREMPIMNKRVIFIILCDYILPYYIQLWYCKTTKCLIIRKTVVTIATPIIIEYLQQPFAFSSLNQMPGQA